jgi:hypothetical protein
MDEYQIIEVQIFVTIFKISFKSAVPINCKLLELSLNYDWPLWRDRESESKAPSLPQK